MPLYTWTSQEFLMHMTPMKFTSFCFDMINLGASRIDCNQPHDTFPCFFPFQDTTFSRCWHSQPWPSLGWVFSVLLPARPGKPSETHLGKRLVQLTPLGWWAGWTPKIASKTLKQCQTKRNFHQLSLGNNKMKHNIQKMSTSFFSSLRSL